MRHKPGVLRVSLFSMGTKGLVIAIAFTFCITTPSAEVTAKWWTGSEKAKKKEGPRMTEAELQSEIMGFADRFGVILSQAFDDFQEQDPSRKAQFIANDDMVYSIASAMTIAAGPNPQVALLDMAALVTLGRMIYEEHHLKKWGKPAEPMVRGFRQAETDVCQIVKEVLTAEQQWELRGMFQEWRKSHPEQLLFSYLRFSDFAATRQKSTLVKAVESGGLFASVKQATQQVEETRLLAERAMFLGTRMPLLTGDFMNVWISRWLTNPEMERILNNMDTVSGSAERLSKELEKLPDRFADERNITVKQVMERVKVLRENIVTDVMDRVTIEREAAIKQLMQELANERKNLMKDLTSEEEGIRPVLAQLNQTLETGNNLVTSANTLADKLDLGDTSEPFNIKDYQETMVQSSVVIAQVDGLLNRTEKIMASSDWKKTVKILVETLDRVEKKGEKVLDYTFWQVAWLIMIFLFGLLLVLICQQYFAKRVFAPKS